MVRFRLTGCRLAAVCACGALAKDGSDTCEKCISRARWSRRKARRCYLDDLRGTRGPPDRISSTRNQLSARPEGGG
jgi:hypothetical protein